MDVVLGMGEVGRTLFDLLAGRGFGCAGVDSDPSRCRGEPGGDTEYLHVCLPGGLEDFAGISAGWAERLAAAGVIIHSTVRPGTTKRVQGMLGVPVLYSPVRGVHRRFLEDMRRYTKVFAADGGVDAEARAALEGRFARIGWMPDTRTAELAKILVDTTYYGWLINYAQITRVICEREGVDYDEMWKFADEIHGALGNRPKMFPGVIGGHCVIPNLALLDHEEVGSVGRINEMFREFAARDP